MAIIYVAKSKAVQKWGAEVGLTKHLYKVGLAAESAEKAIAALNEAAHAGERDWQLVKEEAVADTPDEAAAIERLGRKERMVDPNLYPKIKGARGIFKVKLANAENYILVKAALAGREVKFVKVTPAAIAGYLFHGALE